MSFPPVPQGSENIRSSLSSSCSLQHVLKPCSGKTPFKLPAGRWNIRHTALLWAAGSLQELLFLTADCPNSASGRPQHARLADRGLGL
mmetsp:Transcript_36325/g.93904  ORF Transcript_36325/g.93904 Transcript_36325/m.93904 type:complete len:88 (-) Transcript_36325:320-583(-)